jgi:cysteine synthase
MIYKNLLEAIGNTPLVKIQKLNFHSGVEIFAKLEGNNPGGSVKDRVAKYLIEEAEKRGQLNRKKIILEATSGNTGIGMAMVAAFKGYQFTAVMPANASLERQKLIRLYRGNIILTDSKKGTDGAIEEVKRLILADKKYLVLDQYSNLANVLAHYETTGEEIIKDLPSLDIFVAGMGTGGTLMGVSRRLKEYNSKIKIIGLEPKIGQHIPGLRNMNGYKPFVYEEAMLDKKFFVTEKQAIKITRSLFSLEGISVGISSGAAMWGALEMAKMIKRGKIVVLFPDRRDRYLSLW